MEQAVEALRVVADIPDWWCDYAGAVVHRYAAEKALGRDVSRYHPIWEERYRQAVADLPNWSNRLRTGI